MTFSPFGWELLPFLLPLAPAVLFEYFLFHGHALIGAVGLLLWLPVLWLALVQFNDIGRMRIWLSAPLAFAALVVIGFSMGVQVR